MKEVDADQLGRAIERQHGGKARLREIVPVSLEFQGRLVWQGAVHVFDLEGHPKTSTAYAWSSPIDGSDRRRFYAVLHVPPITSPEAAVRAAIVQEYRTDRSQP